MKQVQEREANGSYEVTYDCGDNILKIVRVDVRGSGGMQSVLEIQKTGLDFLLENIEFQHGLAKMGHKNYRENGAMLLFLDSSEAKDQPRIDDLMTRYASEFKEIFALNDRLKRYLASKFTQLQKYMK